MLSQASSPDSSPPSSPRSHPREPIILRRSAASLWSGLPLHSQASATCDDVSAAASDQAHLPAVDSGAAAEEGRLLQTGQPDCRSNVSQKAAQHNSESVSTHSHRRSIDSLDVEQPEGPSPAFWMSGYPSTEKRAEAGSAIDDFSGASKPPTSVSAHHGPADKLRKKSLLERAIEKAVDAAEFVLPLSPLEAVVISSGL